MRDVIGATNCTDTEEGGRKGTSQLTNHLGESVCALAAAKMWFFRGFGAGVGLFRSFALGNVYGDNGVVVTVVEA